MPHTVKPLPFKPPYLIELSEQLLGNHYENNYGGAVQRLNAIEKRLSDLDWRTASQFDINGLKREELIAANSMLLHEVYFDSLGGHDGLGSPAGEPPEDLIEALRRDFGGVENWRAEFIAVGKALAGGSGWVVLAWSARQGRLVNQWAADHAHTLADGIPILALDMYEHAYHLDFASNAGAYVDAFMKNIHWGRPADRYRQATGPAAGTLESAEEAVSVTPEALRDRLDQGGDLLVLDVRPDGFIFERYGMIPGATVLPPQRIADWIGELPTDRPIVAYCVYGFQVSGDAVAEMRRRGFDARILSGGIAAWNAIGAPTCSRDVEASAA